MDSIVAANQARVLVIYTGGTIGMGAQEDIPGRPLVPQPLASLLRYAVGLDALGIALEYRQFAEPLDSSDVGPAQWRQMAGIVRDHYADFDGFVILHGTDTMAYTASALAFMFEHLAKPVVITGSQLPISHPRTDARQNLVNAVMIAGYRAAQLPCIPEVLIVFADRILRGCRASKVSSTAWAGFDSPNFPPLGSIGERIRVATEYVRPLPPSDAPFRVNDVLMEEVIDVGIFPGMKAAQVRAVLELPSVRGAVLRTFGSGNAPQAEDFLQAVEDAVRGSGKTMVNITQCHQGMVEMGLYAASNGLLERGVVSGFDLTPEAALTKLMWAFGVAEGADVAREVQICQRGEQSESLFDVRFGGSGQGAGWQQEFLREQKLDVRLDSRRASRLVLRLSDLHLDSPDGDPGQMRVEWSGVRPTGSTEWASLAVLALARKQVPSLVQSLPTDIFRGADAMEKLRLRVTVKPGVRFHFQSLSLAWFIPA